MPLKTTTMEDIIYNKVLQVLQPLLDSKAIRQIDLDYGQLEFYEQRPALAFPAVLVEVEFPRTQSLSYDKTIQLVNAVVTLRVVLDVVHETSSITPVLSRSKALERFRINKDIYKLLQVYEDGETGQFDRISQVQEKRDDGYKVTQTKYALTFQDHTAAT